MNALNGNSRALIALVSLLSGIILAGTVAYFAMDRGVEERAATRTARNSELVRAEWDEDVLRLEIRVRELERAESTGRVADEKVSGELAAINKRLDLLLEEVRR